jgi:hypothetical protein
MTKDFDPYHKWLGIPPQEQPPNHYRLLALGLFESDPEVIDAAANRQMAYLQQRATGEHAAISQKLLNELSAARLCLLNREKKAAYDAELKAKQGTASNETTGSQPGSPQPDSLSFLQTTESATDREEVAAKKIERPSTAGQPTATASVSKPIPSPLPKILVGVGGGVVVLAVILFITFGRGKKADVEGDNTTISHRITAAKVETPQPENTAERATEPDKSKGVAQLGSVPKVEAPAIFDVDVDPSSALLEIKDNKGLITGSGGQRQIRIDRLPESGNVLLTASADGYKSSEQWLTPKPGTNAKVNILLAKISTVATSASNAPASENDTTASPDSSEPKKLIPGSRLGNQTEFRVNRDGVVPNPSDLPKVLPGKHHAKNNHRTCFVVRSQGESSLEFLVRTVSAEGAIIECYIDDTLQERFDFPETGQESHPSKKCHVRIPPGQHRLQLGNTGLSPLAIGWYRFQGRFADPD